jgi:putative protease
MMNELPGDKAQPRILAPIKSYEGALRVIQAGADEVYCGVRIPSLDKFELYRGPTTEVQTYDEFEQIVRQAHSYNVKVIVTVNQPFMVDDIEEAVAEHIRKCVDAGADALIVGDLGMLQLVKRVAGGVQLCASTYFSTMNTEAARFLANLGFSRVILERHVPLEQVAEIARDSSVQIEVFVHGSGCSNINVNCYLYHYKFPAMERGLLAIDGVKFPCALPFDIYDAQGSKLDTCPVLDAYTFCSLCKLPEIIRSRVYGLKIEGRGMNEDYQASTTRLYREAVDAICEGDLDRYRRLITSAQNSFIPLPHNLPLNNLKELCCEQERCYYISKFHSPYKRRLKWQTWTKLQCKLLVVQP